MKWKFTHERPALDELAAYWAEAHPLHPLDRDLLERRLFEPELDPELCFYARDGKQLIGLTLGVFPLVKPETAAGLRWLGCRPEWIGRGLLPALAGELETRLRARGAASVRIMATPPFYVRPGIDVRETAVISELLRAGWAHTATHFNLTCDLLVWRAPEEAMVLGEDPAGYCVRRGEPRDRETLAEFNRRLFSAGWELESALAFNREPVSLFVAERAGELLGYAAYEVSQCNGAFGPTGVDPDHRQARLGSRLLWAVLQDLQRLGRSVCEIGWVGPVPFYHQGCGASIGPVYWMLERN